MKIEHPLLVRAIGSTGAACVRQSGPHAHVPLPVQRPAVDPEVARQTGQRYIYAFFHEVMLFPAYYWNWPEMHILISEHRDGELITQVISRLGFTVVRGSTTRGGARAPARDEPEDRSGPSLRDARRPARSARSVHQGVAYLGSRTGFPIVGAGMAFKKPWRAKSWDRFCVPRPFSPAACVVPDAVVVPADADRDTIEVVPPRSRAAHAGRHARSRSLGRGAVKTARVVRSAGMTCYDLSKCPVAKHR